ncbi:MAG: FtsX-like permease family protein [Terrisporobacter sp.]
MKKALNKDFIRDILSSKGRFISIVAIVALGVAFFTGVKSSPIVMKNSSDKYYDDYNLMDVKLLSTLGLTNKDVDEIEKINGVEGVFPTYSIDALSTYSSSENVIKVHGLEAYNSQDKNYINQVKLIEGRLPNKSGECVIEKQNIKFLNYPIGSKIKLSSGSDEKLSDSLKKTEYTVVGYVETPYYLSQEKGNSAIGSGIIEGAIIVPQDDFKMKAYSEVFLTVKGAKKLDTYSDEYFNKVENVTDQLEGIKNNRAEARYQEVLKEANNELKEGKVKLSDAKEDLKKGKAEFEDNKLKAKKELKDAQNKIDNGKNQIVQGKKDLKSKKISTYAQIKDGEEKIKEAEVKINKGIIDYNNALREFETIKATAQIEIDKAQENLNLLKNQINKIKQEISSIEEQLKNENLPEETQQSLKEQLAQNTALLASLQQQYDNGNNELQINKIKLSQSEAQLNNSKIDLDNSKIQLENEKIKLKSAKKTANIEFAKAEVLLKEKSNELVKGQIELDKNKIKVKDELAKGKKELDDADEKIKKAEKEVEDGKKKIDEIEKPAWYILDRNSHQSFVEYEGCAKSIDALAKIFPVFFFAVAALVCLTTMTRMVDEQRINIGTLKGLGYKNNQISKKYILYALSACLIGCFIGTAIGYTLFPTVIFFAYGMMYSIPNIIYIFSPSITLGISILALLVITTAAYVACHKELRETPAILMRPRAPKNGKRILLERIPFIWNRLSFISKVTVRNIFRYKKRFLMTVLGIAGCTALILTGFGIKDSIEMIVTGQYGTLYKYDISIITKVHMSEKEINELKMDLNQYKEINKTEVYSYQNGNIKVNKNSKDITIVTPKEVKNMSEFIHLQDRKTKKLITLNDTGVVITEKMSRDLGIKKGDTIELINSDDKKAKVKVSGITENYISHYAYISPNYYEEVFKNDLNYNRVLGKLNNTNLKMEEKLSKKLFKVKLVEGVRFNTASKETFHYTIKNLNYVVLIMIVSAGALAFVVLYNLTNVNISERIREIATIKVLGFYDKEVSAYIYRENIILTLIGTIVGLGLGKILHQFIMVTVEIQSMMFGRVIDTSSYMIAALLTIVMSCFVNIAMYYKLKNVKMVESLKSVD